MPAAAASPRLLLAAAAFSGAATFAAFFAFEQPGLGIGHFYYVAIAIAATATGPAGGAAAGAAATSLYALGVVVNPHIPPTDVPTVSTGIRALTFIAIGVLVGYFARRDRALVRELRILAERDAFTGLPNVRAFEKAMSERFATGQPFTLLLGHIDRLQVVDDADPSAGADAHRRLSDAVGRALAPGYDVARVGHDEFAVLTSACPPHEARQLADRLERALAQSGRRVTFGWAVSPQEGADGLTLYRVADERLYARKLVRGEHRANVIPLPETASV